MPKDDLENDVEIELPAKEAEPKEVEVDLDSPKPDETKPVAKEPQKAEPSDELAKLHKRMEYQARQFERSTKQVQQLSEELKALREATTSRDQKRVISDNDLDPEIQALAETNWQKAVDKLAEKNKAMGSLTNAKAGNVLYTRAIGYSQINGAEKRPLTAAT